MSLRLDIDAIFLSSKNRAILVLTQRDLYFYAISHYFSSSKQLLFLCFFSKV